MNPIILALDVASIILYLIAFVFSSHNYLKTKSRHALWLYFAVAMLSAALVLISNILRSYNVKFDLAGFIFTIDIDGSGLVAISVLWFVAAYTIHKNIQKARK